MSSQCVSARPQPVVIYTTRNETVSKMRNGLARGITAIDGTRHIPGPVLKKE
jgi:hypothetical protein